jgi:hypothetical protein
LDIETGAVEAWDPDPGSGISTIQVFEKTLYVGGGFKRASGNPSAGLAAFSLLPVNPDPGPAPAKVFLLPIRPNPVRARSTIRFALPSAGTVDLAIFDVQGRRVASLLNREVLAAGWHEVSAQAENWPGGFYFCRLEVGGNVTTQKFVVLK